MSTPALELSRPLPDRTLPHRAVDRPLVGLRVEVIAGPDKGRVFSGPCERATVGTARGNDLVLSDETVSRHHLELLRQGDRVLVEDHGSTNGTTIGSAQLHRASVARGSVLRLGRSALRVDDGERYAEALHGSDDFHGLRGSTAEMRRLMAQIDRVARSDAAVLLHGETGTGKEMVARAVHRASLRAAGPLEVVDCGALIPTLIASELFGHEKGAFTGANQQHAGAFERAEGGTIFLDEIGELPEQLQVMLLGVLERRAFKRVGGSKLIPTNVRVVAATHRDLRRRVNQGDFRQDLYYRLAVARLYLPALRERREDIPLLVRHFLGQLGAEREELELFPQPVMSALEQHGWPGNVRELRNFVESAVAFGQAQHLEEDEPPEERAGEPRAERGFLSLPLRQLMELSYTAARARVLTDFQTYYFGEVLRRSGGNVTRAAGIARMNRPHLIQLLKRHGMGRSAGGAELGDEG